MVLPGWMVGYRREWLVQDALAGLVVTLMVVPQCLAYAVLAGLPAQLGLYASILPLVAYALLGSSMTLAIGPAAVVALMTAGTIGPLAPPGSPEYIALAVILAMLSGLALLALGVLRLGFLAQLLSEPVISGFVSGAALLILVGQLGPLMGITPHGQTAFDLGASLFEQVRELNPATLALGALALPLLWWARRSMAYWLERAGLRRPVAELLTRLVPLLVLTLATVAVVLLDLDRNEGVAVVGNIPEGLPVLHMELPSVANTARLLMSALVIGLMGFVVSVSVAQSLAQRRMERVDPNAELRALGVANLVSALSGAFPVAGSMSQSVANFSAGARTPLAGVVRAGITALIVVGFTAVFERVPRTALAATIIIAVLSLIDFQALRRDWKYDRADGLAWLGTALGVILLGVEAGISIGIGLTLAALLWRSSRPHIAVVGRVPGTEHFRNVARHSVETDDNILALRVDENLHFGNAVPIDERIRSEIAHHPRARHLVLELSSVIHIDGTALKMLEGLEQYVRALGWELHFAQMRGPVLDKLRGTALFEAVTASSGGAPFPSTHEAFVRLAAHARAAQQASGS